MTERYDRIAAAHYAVYRPPLHQLILRRVLSPEASFSVGLDVGCGTGYSAIALADHCARVYGIDPSLAMLRQATAHERVSYLAGAAESLPVPNRSVEVVTFAGSLFYADAEATREELRRICREGAIVVAYDFEVRLEAVLQRFGIELQAGESDYDHRVNFSGAPGFEELDLGSERVALEATASELAHILLSDSYRFDRFAKRYRAPDPFPALVEDLQPEYQHASIAADIYYARYRMSAQS